jgi:hypothetical protein
MRSSPRKNLLRFGAESNNSSASAKANYVPQTAIAKIQQKPMRAWIPRKNSSTALTANGHFRTERCHERKTEPHCGSHSQRKSQAGWVNASKRRGVRRASLYSSVRRRQALSAISYEVFYLFQWLDQWQISCCSR